MLAIAKPASKQLIKIQFFIKTLSDPGQLLLTTTSVNFKKKFKIKQRTTTLVK